MQATDKPELGRILRAVYALHARECTPDLLELWFSALSRYEIGSVRSALSAAVMDRDTGQFLPKPADVIRKIEGGSTEDRATIAWAKVERAIRSVGPWASVLFDDERIHVVIAETGGWPKLCEVTDEDLPFKAREFQARYRSLVNSPVPQYLTHLPGAAEISNSAKGYALPSPQVIGDEQRALGVYHGGQKALPKAKSLAELLAAMPAKPETPSLPKRAA